MLIVPPVTLNRPLLVPPPLQAERPGRRRHAAGIVEGKVVDGGARRDRLGERAGVVEGNRAGDDVAINGVGLDGEVAPPWLLIECWSRRKERWGRCRSR